MNDKKSAALGLGFIVFLLWAVWFVILSVLLSRKVESAGVAAATG